PLEMSRAWVGYKQTAPTCSTETAWAIARRSFADPKERFHAWIFRSTSSAPATMKSVLLRAICFAVLIPSFGSCRSSLGSNSTTSGQQRSCPAFESSDAGWTCSKAAAYVACSDPSGAICDCLSSDLTGCNEPSNCNPAHGYSCTDLCSATEYAVVCGVP